MDQILLTPAALLHLLSQIDELKSVDVGVTETIDGQLQIQIGQSTYIVSADDATEVVVDDATFNTVDEANLDAYNNIEDTSVSEYAEGSDVIESGIIKELAKSLLLGGMIRLSAKLLK